MRIYLDYAATTYLDSEVISKMLPYFGKTFGNPSSQHWFGREAIKAIDEARALVAKCLKCKDNEIYFTSGGTESDNWAVKGIASANKDKGNHIITSAIEHPAILQSLKVLEKQGFEITYLTVDNNGLVKLDELKKAITDKTILITIMTANNEIGTIQPIEEIGKIAKEHNIPLHTDAVQAMGCVDFDVKKMNIDLLSLSAHKFYGPKGIGVLYIRNGLKIDRFMSGGEQERARRSGTHNTPNIVGLAEALRIATEEREENNKKISALRDYMIDRVLNEIPYTRLNGDRTKRLANNANFSFEFIEGESILLTLDLKGIAASSGSACSSGSLEPSHVLLAIGVPVEISHGSIRFTLGKTTTKEEIDYTVDTLKNTVEYLRNMSPLFNEFKGDVKYV